MSDLLIQDALQHALENISGQNLAKDHYSTTIEMLNAFNDTYKCVVTFSVIPEGATIVVKDSNGKVISADDGGTYSLREGTYKYSITADDYTGITNKTLNISQSDVTTGTKTVTETLTRVNCVVGFTVTNEGLDVDIVVKKGTQTLEPDSEGKYHVPSGSYTYTASAEGYTTQSDVSLSVSAGDVSTGTKTVSITMVET